jgi:hypothetical protein
MTHQSIHCESLVQEAGQAAGAAPPWSAGEVPEGPGDSDRVAGGKTASDKTSTAALASFHRDPLLDQRRAPRHPKSFLGVASGGGPPSINITFRPGVQREKTMIPTTKNFPGRSFTATIPVILRITLSLLLWTLGVSAMDLRIAQIQPKERRSVVNFPVNKIQAQHLQRWVNAGHDPWCRDPQLVAAAALRRVSPQLGEAELAALPLELENRRTAKAVYTFHSLDGRSTYRITLRRFRFLLPTAGSVRQIIWLPENAEIITRDARE